MIALHVQARVVAPRLDVDLSAIAHNTRTIAARTNLMAVVKADGFGHGAADIARTALANGATSLGVATIDEALALRAALDSSTRAGAGTQIPGTHFPRIATPSTAIPSTATLSTAILAWLSGPDADFDAAVIAGIHLAAPSTTHLTAIVAAARRTRATAHVHLHVDTGMARDGAPREHWLALAAAARRAERRGDIIVAGLMSHLARAGEPGHPATAAAIAAFREAETVVRSVGLRPRIRHLAATAAAITEPAARFDLCRVGAGLYGIAPRDHGLREALTLTAPVVTVRDVPARTPVGYGHTYVTDRATRLALVPLGYGDGIPRLASAHAEVLVRGRRVPLAGTISMDQLVIDVGELGVEPGETVTVFGPGDNGEPTVAEWARWAQTIPHEIMTGLGGRIPRSTR
jgi:alanine racemase